MTAALRIAVKDLRQRVRDRSAFLWGIVAPVGLAFIFSLVLGNVTDPDALGVEFAAVDRDGGSLARVFVDEVLGEIDGRGIASVREVEDPAEAESLVAEGKVDAVFVIPAGFSAAAEGGGSSMIDVIGNVDSPIASQVARSIAGRFADEINAVGASVGTLFAVQGEVPDGAAAEAAVEGALAVPWPIRLAEVDAASKELSSETFYSAGMAVMFLFLTVQFGVLGLLEERTGGTLSRLLAAPIPRYSIVLGKAVTSFVLGVVSMAAVITITSAALGADWGNPAGVAVLVVAGVLSAMGVLTIIAAYARSAEQAGNLQAIVAFLLAMLGGSFFPIAEAGGLVATLSLATPHAWFLRGLGDLAAGGSVADVIPAVSAILAFAVVTMAIGALRLRRVVTA